MQVVNILGNDANLKQLLEFCQSLMAGMRTCGTYLTATLVVKIQDQPWIMQPTFRTGYGHHIMPGPKTSGISKGLQPALGADAGTRKDNQ